MRDQSLTEGARRALELAARVAADSQAAEIEPVHLLWALALEESRASEILAEHDLDREKLAAHCPAPFTPELLEAIAAGTAPAEPPQTLSPGETVRDVLNEARRQVRSAGRQAEVGTEFLLSALASVPSPVADLLQAHGLADESLEAQIERHSGFTGAPIDVDFHIAWRERTADEHTDTLRVLDAAANRAREGLRVLEDFVRFRLDDAHLTALLKHCRHDLTAALRELGSERLLASRDTPGDVGTSITTASEVTRTSPRDVLHANFKRVQEAVRTLEEFGKVISSELAGPLEQLRYRLYTLERAVLLTQASRQRLAGRNLYLLVTETACLRGSGPAIRESIAGGAGVVQIREKSLPDRKLLEHARRVREWTREGNALLIINDRPDLAVLADADGVHVGQEELSVREARRIVGPDRMIGVSTHTIEQARQAVLDGADYLGVGPVFPSKTKHFDQHAGLAFVREVAAEITLPWFAIGGIDADNLPQVLDAGAARVAVSGAICGAEHPGNVAATLKSLLDTAASQKLNGA